MIKTSTLDYIKESFKKNEFVEKPTCYLYDLDIICCKNQCQRK